jgi:peptidylprolyl isomerase
MKKLGLILIIILVVIVLGLVLNLFLNKEMNDKKIEGVIETSLGDITLEFYSELAPVTVNNFISLANEDFYKDVKFHRVMKGFMIQAGDPLTKDDSLKDRWGTGGPGYYFNDEIHENNFNVYGTISMANAGPDTNGSQFFINVADNNFLNTKHTVFGKVIDGMDVVHRIENVETDSNDRPIESVIIKDIKIVEK